jgi:hypothetical protein
MLHLSRRTFLAAGAFLTTSGLVAGAPLTPALGRMISAASKQGYYRYQVGEIEVTAL